jgi:hypothetical protein
MMRWLRIAGIVLGLALVVTLMLWINRVRDVEARVQCQGCMSSIASAILGYHEKHGHFPPAYLVDAEGKPAHSWRVLILESIEPQLYAKYNFKEPWDGPNNRKLAASMPEYYACAADPEARRHLRTNYFVVTGEQTLFPGSVPVSFKAVRKPYSEVILLIESLGEGIHWMEPRDITFDSMNFVIDANSGHSVSARHRRGPNICTVDGTARTLVDVTPDMLRQMFVIRPRE